MVSLDDFYFMNYGTPKSSERFHNAQIKGGFLAEKRFTHGSTKGKFDAILPGFSMFNITNDEKIAGNQKYILAAFHQNPEDYLVVVSNLMKVDFFEEFFIVSYSKDTDDWTLHEDYRYGKPEKTITIPRPEFSISKYNREANSFEVVNISIFLDNFAPKKLRVGRAPRDLRLYQKFLGNIELEILDEIYAERYFIQVLLRNYKTPMQDFDMFIRLNGKWHLTEIKQKDSDANDYFGWDTNRIMLYYYVMMKSNLSGGYLIAEIDNQEDRNHVRWLYIDIEKMLENISWSAPRGTTVMLSRKHFMEVG
jgi:hypothetical protein